MKDNHWNVHVRINKVKFDVHHAGGEFQFVSILSYPGALPTIRMKDLEEAKKEAMRIHMQSSLPEWLYADWLRRNR